jgi:predicted glycosyltransferase
LNKPPRNIRDLGEETRVRVVSAMNRIYYTVKPAVPWSIRIALRRMLIRRRRMSFQHLWPIHEPAGTQPPGWPGWPDGKRFSFVLTHDVEGEAGLNKCKQVAELESNLGFRAAFNLIPEGSYVVPRQLRDDLTTSGFEVGIHDLNHDGKLFSSRRLFMQRAKQINRYLEEWKAVGFRSAFMHHNLEWIKMLNVRYDTSTFDTDPFEPQPDGVDTVFPFMVKRADRSGYVELPYTIPQDFTLFILLQENSIDIWKRKLDWIAKRGGMALLNTHPDYMSFHDAARPANEYPATLYQQFLEYVRTHYDGAYWHALPVTVADFITGQIAAPSKVGNKPTNQPAVTLRPPRKVWIDMDNTPHVPFFEPIINNLINRGYSVQLTGRDAFQVSDLAKLKGMKILQIGRHYGKNRIAKLFGLYYRALQLMPHVTHNSPVLAVSHGSRSQIFLCKMLGIPAILLADYEYAKHLPFEKPTWMIIPEVIPEDAVCCAPDRILKYPGIKENVYVSGFQPDPTFLGRTGLNDANIIVTVRPPATEAHYHNPESDALLYRVMARLNSANDVQVVLLPRNKAQTTHLAELHPDWFSSGKLVVPTALDGLNLIYYSDLVISGGGTMNREAAALNVPVYSIFRGRIGAIDRYLNECGRLVLIESIGDVDSKIQLKRRNRQNGTGSTDQATLEKIVEHIEYIYDFITGGAP